MTQSISMRQGLRRHLSNSSGRASRFGTSPLSPPQIEPLKDLPDRPFWSVMIPIYNCAGYLRDTLASVLAQDPGAERMQIEVVDNCSTDDPEAVVRELGGDRVAFYRQARNVGAIENFNSCIRRARGEWVHILHGDDTVQPGFYDRLQQDIAEHPAADAAICRVIYIDEEGHWTWLTELEARCVGILSQGFAAKLMIDQSVYFVGTVIRRSAYEQLGGFRPEFTHCADWDMWKRIALQKNILYEPRPLACYRLHAGADSARAVRTGENVIEERQSIRLSCGAAPRAEVKTLHRDAMKAAAIRAARRAERLWRAGDRKTALVQLHQALLCSRAPAVLARVARLLGIVLLNP